MPRNRNLRLSLILASATLAAGCVPATNPDGTFEEVPEAILAVAAPYQDLRAVRRGPNDNCYWYLHRGPVEDTWLPLRTSAGNLICEKA